ncbi:hypothetical protein LPJ63_001738 [Coemansia sp. RSA 2711]|nr:hypothetical protein LPJ63_001738 [Coemansia sp. RSA 2711]
MSQQTAFRRAEKQYKARDRRPDLSTVIDLAAIETSNEPRVRRLCLTRDLCTPSALPFRVFTESRPHAYAIHGHPGLIVIPNPFTDESQRWLARKCLCDCTQPPNRTNLDPFFDMPAASLFTLASKPSKRQCAVDSRVQLGIMGPDITQPKDKFYSQPAMPADLLERLRWCTLGWQYNWTTKKYDLGASAFDSVLNELMRSIAVAIGNPASAGGDACSDNSYDGSQFSCQAGIINYYDERTTMAGHVDKTEETMDAPLISLSVGLTCVYLIGGPTRETEPTPLLLHSGDILAMCGESRLAFHGVPRVLANTSPVCLTKPDAGDNDFLADKYPAWRHFAVYLNAHRINCNARKCL